MARHSLIVAPLLSLLLGAAPVTRPGNMSYLDNGVIRIGVSLDVGGAITHLSKSGADAENLVNNWDWGRQIQMSHYSGPVPFVPQGNKAAPMWAGLGWNPVQAGDAFRNPSKVIEHRNDTKTITIRCVPMQWPLENAPSECEFETTIKLEKNTARVACRLLNHRADRAQYAARGQELPAVYTIGKLYRLFTYRGQRPFTGDATVQIKKKPPHTSGMPVWDYWTATEHWAALVNDDDFGVGIWNGDAYDFCGGFHGKEGAGTTRDDPTGYVAPTGPHVIDHNIDFRYSYVLIVGSLDGIRQYAVDHAPKKGELPSWRFGNHRLGWHYVNAADMGWPIRGELHVKLNGDDPQIVGPTSLWRAEDGPRLRIEAAFSTSDPSAVVYFRSFGDATFTTRKHAAFEVNGDGEYRVYEVDLSASPAYRGVITGIRIDPAIAGEQGEWVKIHRIEVTP